MQPLPIDPLLPELVRTLRSSPALVLEAPPGAGKTTRVPRALLEGDVVSGEIVVLQPRRLPTRLAAQRVAEELGEPVGERIGYSVRFEEVASRATRVKFVTEGILTRRLLADPALRGVGAVVLDEFHERHLAGDLALALLKRLQREARPDLKLLVMSATLAAEPVADWLGGAPRLRSEGRRFDVAIEYLEKADERPLHEQVAGAVKRLLRDGLDGDVLVFLPGAGEIRRAAEALAPVAESADLLVLPLHGDLPLADQNRAVRPADRRKVILSTNVAETSVTIEGIAAVVDTGLARVAGHSPWSGLPTLQIGKISKASAIQRAGRAGRTRAGRALRLYTRHDFDGRPDHDPPEILRLDLAETLLSLHGAGVSNPRSLEWFEAPAAAALDSAELLLKRLGALDSRGKLSAIGQRLLKLPVHPRLGRMIVEGERRGVGADASLLAALTAERDIRLESRTFGGRGASRVGGSSDLIELMERFREAEGARFARERLRSFGLDPRAVEAADRARKQLSRLVRDEKKRPADPIEAEEALLIATLAGFPDRVAKRRTPTSRELVLSGGGSAQLSESSVVHDAALLVAVDVEERGARPGAPRTGNVRLASSIEPEWLLDLFPDELTESDERIWNGPAERVDRVSRISYGAVALEESRSPAPPSPETARVLVDAALARGLAAFAPEGALDGLVARIDLVARCMPEAGLPTLGEAELREALVQACEGLRSFAELREASLPELLLQNLTHDQQRLLAAQAPERISLPGGRGAKVHYEAGKPPWVESRLQDFFGMAQGPAVCAGRVPLTLHLLAPNGRAVQVTQDLAGFWERHYPAIRKELGRRYPRHSWPEDGRTAVPPAVAGRRH